MKKLSRFIDAVLSEAPTLRDWMRSVVSAAAPVFADGGGEGAAITRFETTGATATFGETELVGDAHVEGAVRAAAVLDGSEFLRQSLKPFRVSLLSRQYGRDSMVGVSHWEQTFGNFQNALGMMSSTGPFTLSTLIGKRSVKSELWTEFRTMQRYLSVAIAERPSGVAQASADAAIDSRGHMVHCETSAAQSSRSLLSAGAKALEQARTRRGADEEGEAIWDELLRGGWGVVEHIESDGKRLLLLRKRQHTSIELSRAEQAVLSRACSNASSKEIANELGLAMSTVSEHLTSGLEKLGFRSRVELLRAMPRQLAAGRPAAE